MAYSIDDKLIIAVASSALFDLKDSDAVFRQQGESAYRSYQREHEFDTLPTGVAFPFIRRLLSLNEVFPELKPIEVILVSRNDPDTGQRVFNSIRSYDLDISRGAFLSGGSPHTYLESFHASLFLSGHKDDVVAAIEQGYAAGLVLASSVQDPSDDPELRIAYDFDGVIADDSAETVFQESSSISEFHHSETLQEHTPHNPGPLRDFFVHISRLQKLERERKQEDPSYPRRIKTAIITARNAPSNRRVVTTLRSWDVTVDQTFFLGGIEKKRILQTFKPHIFFDDQLLHLEDSAQFIPSVHIPFGVINKHHIKTAAD
jgi:5'-nucleotidase